MPTFKHSGAIGDVVYSLPAVRALGGGDVYLQAGGAGHFWTSLYGDPVPVVRRLLEAQPYVGAVRPYEGQRVDFDLDRFRGFFATHCHPETVTLCDMHLMAFGLPSSERDSAWLGVPPKALPAGREVVICRSARYHSPFFSWERVLGECGGRAVFCGLPSEHQAFVAALTAARALKGECEGAVPYLPTEDLYELARYVAAARLFVGNQSSPFAVAEGLKADTLQEVCPDCPNCVFVRPGASYRSVY